MPTVTSRAGVELISVLAMYDFHCLAVHWAFNLWNIFSGVHDGILQLPDAIIMNTIDSEALHFCVPFGNYGVESIEHRCRFHFYLLPLVAALASVTTHPTTQTVLHCIALHVKRKEELPTTIFALFSTRYHFAPINFLHMYGVTHTLTA